MIYNMTTGTCAIIENNGKIPMDSRVADQMLAGKWEFLKNSIWKLAHGTWTRDQEPGTGSDYSFLLLPKSGLYKPPLITVE